jgi:hypothetical protein
MEAIMEPLIVLALMAYSIGVLFTTISLFIDPPWMIKETAVMPWGPREGDIVHTKVRFLSVRQILTRSARHILLWPWRAMKWTTHVMEDDPKTKSARYERDHPKR